MDFLTLSQLNTLISEEIQNAFPDTYWLMAETSDVRLNKNGHCYLEFIEKNVHDNNLVAKARGYIWSNTFQALRPYFEAKTGQAFVSGIKVLVRVSVEFHPVYGFGLNVYDIDPAYTTGDMQQRRQQILNRLETEGVLLLNKELEMSLLPQRIAIITSPTAAGYEDFLDHLLNNASGLAFYPCLFPAVMQGEQTEQTIIAALNAIYERRDQFDAVVIIRGGGATSDLASFDTYPLAVNCAQFPLPIITGIGHERDDTVLDFVAHYRAKTPTAAADYLVNRLETAGAELQACKANILLAAHRLLETATTQIRQTEYYLPAGIQNTLDKQRLRLTAVQNELIKGLKQFVLNEENKLNGKEAFFKWSSPEYILSKGYSLTMKDGKAVKSFQSLAKGDRIETLLHDGSISSIIASFGPNERRE
ncbi:MAG: exodeoxyribonuclease VII large subunit [Dysgonamonadaceae bacterium]|jgi:exodeoxyribonuclease VII large subunit|nr:exodeoxyribonuclease VII large subunit [Dysgonamonadaceae bacterium]